MQRVYIARHGQTIDNVLGSFGGGEEYYIIKTEWTATHQIKEYILQQQRTLEEFYTRTGFSSLLEVSVQGMAEITPRGHQQAGKLGVHLSKQNLQNPLFITSDLTRNNQTLYSAVEQMDISLELGVNHIRSGKFNEETPAEYMNDQFLAFIQDKPEWLQWAVTRPTKAEVGKRLHEELMTIIAQHPERDIVAVLHGTINKCLFSNYLQVNYHGKTQENCSVWHGIIQDGTITNAALIPFEKLDKDI